MENSMIQINNIELLGRVLDGQATEQERNAVLFNLADSAFKEYFFVALKATALLNEKANGYGKIQ
ncbi:hypothetical protein JCM10556A_24610 [Bacteroides acidifaciens]|uniref:hypothetical protein n=1 Tax=Bacteroides acidifaciens TaxID=85831 RepID=UPI000469C6F2|nr:hypothetical protein [Bacteroides acidifaciens]